MNPWSIGTHTPCLLSRKCPTTKQKGKLKNDHSIYFTFAAVYNSNKKVWQFAKYNNIYPLSPVIKMHILLTVLHTFLMELVRRIKLSMSGISGFPLGSSRTGYQRISLFCVTRKLDAKSRAVEFQQKFCPKIEKKKTKFSDD